MRILCIDTSTTDLVTGLVDIDPVHPVDVAPTAVLSYPAQDATVVDTRAHHELLMPTIDALLGGDYSQLDAVVAGCGPGPFTGLRVGMATASALAQARGIPVYGLCSHDAIAVAAAAQLRAAASTQTADADNSANPANSGESANPGDPAQPGVFVVATDARRKEIYYSIYRGSERLSGPDVARPEDCEFPATVTAIYIPAALGERLPEKWHDVLCPALNPRPGALAAAVDFAAEPQPLVPLYLRRPDAKEPMSKPRSAAIPEVQL